MTRTKACKRYSEGFKRQVVAEYEDGASATALCRKYGIGSISTVTAWVKQYAREGLRHEVVHIQTPDEARQLQQLERERDLLQHALADLTVRNLLLEGQLRVYQETYGEAVLKKNVPASSSTPTSAVKET
jgi:transposase-like protein